jgi:hypothetical protein
MLLLSSLIRFLHAPVCCFQTIRSGGGRASTCHEEGSTPTWLWRSIRTSADRTGFPTSLITWPPLILIQYQRRGETTSDTIYSHDQRLCSFQCGVERRGRVVRIQESPCSNLGLEINYPDWGCSMFFSVPPSKFRDSTGKLGHDRFLPPQFQFIIHYHPFIRRYIASTKKASETFVPICWIALKRAICFLTKLFSVTRLPFTYLERWHAII